MAKTDEHLKNTLAKTISDLERMQMGRRMKQWNLPWTWRGMPIAREDSQQNGFENQQYGWKVSMMEQFIKDSELFRFRVENKQKCWKQKYNKKSMQ